MGGSGGQRPGARLCLLLLLIAAFVGSAWAVAPATATANTVLINEILASHGGTDTTEFVELIGPPGTSLDGLSLIVVESKHIATLGQIDRRIDFTTTQVVGPNGFFLIGNPAGLNTTYGVVPDVAVGNNFLQNSSQTIALVETASLTGALVTGSEVVRDAVALSGPEGGQFFFRAPVVGPDCQFFQAGTRRRADGVDTGTVADWSIAAFNLDLLHTPGGPNPVSPLVAATSATIMEIQGSGATSPLDSQRATTTGIVTAFTAPGSDHDAGFWIQDGVGDGDPATSDGIFVVSGAIGDERRRRLRDRDTAAGPPSRHGRDDVASVVQP